ncbi:MAG: O-antigen ligase family protein [Bacillota bacterium]
MFFLAIYSIVSYILRPFIFNYRAIFPHFFNASGLPMFHLGASVIIDHPSYYRLFGIFRESGVYQIFLNIAILFELFIRSKGPRFSYISIFLITIFLTFSTPGYFGAAALLFAYIVFHRNSMAKDSKKKIVYFVLILFILALFIYNISPELSRNFDSALSKFFNKESSYVGRRTSILVELKLWSERPLFGYGITTGIDLSKYYGSQILGEFMYNTSTFTGMLVTLGGIFTIGISIMLIKSIWRIRASYVVKLLILSTIVLILSSQLMMYNAYLYAFMFFGLLRKRIV